MKQLRVTIISILCILAIRTLTAKEKPLIHVLVPRFDGDPAIGAPVATVLNLQLWRTLRPSPEVKTAVFSGKVTWSPEALSEQSHTVAEEVAQRTQPRAQMVLWGKAWAFGNGVVAQSYLSIPDYQDLRPTWPERWYVKFTIRNIEVEMEPDLPTRRYEFPALPLRAEVVSEFQEVGSLRLYHDKELSKPRGKLGLANFTAKDHLGNRSMITLDDEKGRIAWVRIPNLSNRKSYIVDFVGGLVRVFRGDYAGAQELFASVASAKDASQQLKLDSLLYLAYSADRLGKDPLIHTTAALKLNPYSAAAVRYHLMAQSSLFARRAARANPDETKRFQSKLKTILHTYEYLLSPNDPILTTTKAIANASAP